MDLDVARLGARVRHERIARGLSLEDLAARSEVSRSMLSAIERGEKSPTIVVLHRVATGLGLTLTRLLEPERSAAIVVLRRREQTVVRDPAGWERRNLATSLPECDFEFMRTVIPAGIDAGVYPPHPPGSREFVAVERGRLRLTIGGETVLLDAGDSISYEADQTHSFKSDGDEECVYYLAVGSLGAGRGDEGAAQ